MRDPGQFRVAMTSCCEVVPAVMDRSSIVVTVVIARHHHGLMMMLVMCSPMTGAFLDDF
jgi:hypothetical protein